jgi:hypothetical protein
LFSDEERVCIRVGAQFYVTTQPGTRMELSIDPTTGTIIGGV